MSVIAGCGQNSSQKIARIRPPPPTALNNLRKNGRKSSRTVNAGRRAVRRRRPFADKKGPLGKALAGKAGRRKAGAEHGRSGNAVKLQVTADFVETMPRTVSTQR